MWKEIRVDSQKFLVKHSRRNEMCIIYLTNLVSIWSEEISPSLLIERCKVKNPLIEADEESLIQHILSLLDGNKENVVFSSDMGETHRKLEVKTKLAGVPFHFTFELTLMSPDVLCKEITQPLVLLANQVITQQNALCNLLEAKDAEIEEYKLEGAQLKRRKLETTSFNRTEFLGTSVLSPSVVSSCMSVIGHEENSNGSMENHEVKTNGPSHSVEDNGSSAVATYEGSQLKRISIEFKEEPSSQAESKNIKKRKQAKPKLHF